MSPPLVSAEALCQDAEQQSGLDNWGDRRFIEPLQIYLDSLAASAQLHDRGRKVAVANITRLLKNRLYIQQELHNDPTINQRELSDLLVIFGMPRTGSTLLQNLLACDPAARSLRYYESYTPVKVKAETLEDPRIRTAELQLRVMNRLAPGLTKIHAIHPTGPEECSRLMEHSFVDTLFEIRNWVPEYSEWLHANESRRHYYEEYRTLLQLLDMEDHQTHWMCKSPRHLTSLENLVAVFPNVKLVWTHRDPAYAVPSVASLSAEASAIGSKHVDKTRLGNFWLDRTSKAVHRGLAYRQTDDSNRYVDVEYEDLVEAPIRTVQQIYAQHRYTYSDEFELNMKSWLAEHPKNQHGRHYYSPEEYGLTPEQIRQRFPDIH